MIIIKFIVIAASWLHAWYHDKVSGYVTFFSLIILWIVHSFVSHNGKKKQRSILVSLLNVLVLISVLAFVVTLHFYN